MTRESIAKDTLAILERGGYTLPDGMFVSLTELQRCIQQTRGFTPEELAVITQEVAAQPAPFAETRFAVANQTTLQGAESLASDENFAPVGVLNFASAKNPGGGFLRGAHAQEESLARSSGLYQSLLSCRSHYEFHRMQTTCLYSDRMIFSPHCPVFRRDGGELLRSPYHVHFLTSPAPNAGVVRRQEQENAVLIETVLQERSAKLLALAAAQGCRTLVLGAWGCGVFQNDPEQVAQAFRTHLQPGGAFWGRFFHIQFSVYDTSRQQTTFQAFADRFF